MSTKQTPAFPEEEYCSECGTHKTNGHRLDCKNVIFSRRIGKPIGMTAPPLYEHHIPAMAATRKAQPVTTGVLDYFPDAFLAVAHLSKVGNDQHNPGEPLHWARGKSNDHPDCLARHLLERGALDVDGVRHSAKVAWRALAILQLELEAAGEASISAARRPVSEQSK